MSVVKIMKKPVIVEALQYTGDNMEDMMNFVPDDVLCVHETPAIKTMEGVMDVKIGAWVIKGVKGEFYPCDDEIKQMTYSDVEPDGAGTEPEPVEAPQPKKVERGMSTADIYAL